MKLTAPTVEAMPSICSPKIQKSMLWPGENVMLVWGA